MTMRKTTKAQEIESAKIELANRKLSLERLMCKLETSGWTKDDKELADEHVRFINRWAPRIKEFYKPAMVISE